MSERMIKANGVDLCIETFGDPADPAILLIHGACASMLWWESELCAAIAARGRFVIRYDQRDTGRSVSYPPGQPGYAASDLARDAVGILDVLGVERAHVVGRSMGGGIALAVGLDHADRVTALTFVTTSPGGDDLPPAALPYVEPGADVVENLVADLRAYAGGSPHFDEPAMRSLAEQDVARTTNLASVTNHFHLDFDAPATGGFADVRVPTLVVHGDLDPAFPLPHGEALRDAIPGARLLVLEATGHEVPRFHWSTFVDHLTDDFRAPAS
jgi:pimeloyl-ACP methyl ester carboxylesterase